MRISPRKITAPALLLIAACLITGCEALNPKYAPPAPGEPAALVKLKYAYVDVLPGKQIVVAMSLKQPAGSYKNAYSRNYPTTAATREPTTLDIASVNLHAGQQLEIVMSLKFRWRETRWVQQNILVNGQPTKVRRQVREWVHRGCTAGLYLTPEAGKVYLLDYTNANINTNCTIAGYEQMAIGEGKFKLKKAGSFMQVR